MPDLQFNEEKHEYTYGGRIIPSVTQIISAVGLYEFDFVSRDTLAVAAERGRIVHTYIEWYEKGILDESSIDPELAGYFEAYKKMKSELAIPTPDEIEKRVYSPTYGYAGTYDQCFTNLKWINDHKTGVKSLVHGIQLSAYWLALHPNMNDKPGRLTCDYLTLNGEYELVEYPYEPLAWIAIKSDYNWRVKNNLIKRIWQ